MLKYSPYHIFRPSWWSGPKRHENGGSGGHLMKVWVKTETGQSPARQPRSVCDAFEQTQDGPQTQGHRYGWGSAPETPLVTPSPPPVSRPAALHGQRRRRWRRSGSVGRGPPQPRVPLQRCAAGTGVAARRPPAWPRHPLDWRRHRPPPTPPPPPWPCRPRRRAPNSLFSNRGRGGQRLPPPPTGVAQRARRPSAMRSGRSRPRRGCADPRRWRPRHPTGGVPVGEPRNLGGMERGGRRARRRCGARPRHARPILSSIRRTLVDDKNRKGWLGSGCRDRHPELVDGAGRAPIKDIQIFRCRLSRRRHWLRRCRACAASSGPRKGLCRLSLLGRTFGSPLPWCC